MPSGPLRSPVIIDGVVSEEKVAELLALQAEYPELDYKQTIELTTAGVVELAKDIGAMQVRGGYILGGVDNQGGLTGRLDGADLRPFDEANLVPKLQRYLPRPLELRTSVVERNEEGEDEAHKVVAICVLPHPAGCAFFLADGKYDKNGREKVVFREGDVFWRDGTRSVRMSQAGLEEVIERRIGEAKDGWMAEQQEIRRRERDELEAAYRGREAAEGPLGAVSLDLPADELNRTALDLIRRNDPIALRRLLNDATARARALVEREDIESGLSELLDKLACLTATFLEYEQEEWFERVVQVLVQIYATAFGEDDARRFGITTRISREELAPQVWLAVIERIYGLGALAVRSGNWQAIRVLTLQLPEPLAEEGYDTNWLRHTLTMASRAQHFEREQEGQTVSLLSLARSDAARLDCLRPDGVAPDDEALLTSLAQFDILSNVVAIGDAQTVEGRVFYPNFARFRQTRVQQAAERLLNDPAMREALFPLDDADLATALQAIGNVARSEGWRYDGFEGWDRTPVGEFIEENLPESQG